jgi:signal-transduction protein with cAMP-binding, CBS, and nucleotidyltransferase domain
MNEKLCIRDVMSKQLVSMDADRNAFQAAKKMSEKNTSSIVITDSGKIVGILTERDLIKQVCAADLQASKTPVASIMSAPLIAIDKDSAVEKAAEIMIKNKVRHLGVRDSSSNHQIIGIISSRDLIRLLIHKLESHAKIFSWLDLVDIV